MSASRLLDVLGEFRVVENKFFAACQKKNEFGKTFAIDNNLKIDVGLENF